MSPKIYAVEYIGAQDAARINAFSKDDQGNYFEHRNTGRALPYTKNISGRLTDHTGIDYSRTATEAERETIYKAMMGTVIVHGSSFEAFYQRSNALGHAGYDSHFNALEVIDESINILWKSVKRGTYFGRLDQVTRDESRQSLLTKHFVKWFYEALESYCHDLNFFGGTASFDWFQQTCSSFSERRTSEYDLEIEYSSRRKGIKHIHIHDTKGFKIAVLKPNCDARIAATYPPGPEPITTISKEAWAITTSPSSKRQGFEFY